MAHDNIIYQGDFHKLSEARKLFIGSKSDSWKFKYIVLVVKENVPILELHKKKPKPTKKSDKTLTDSYQLPAFKVEKLKNARGRSFVCEITASSFHLFLSADEEKQIDILVFLLQAQLHLKEEIRDDIVRVVPENSDCQKRIGAKGSNCLLHVSPWGITLVLERSRCLLAQWPLKSIRYYEASGTGHFTIEAGKVAPMGEGIFGFQTLVGEDDVAYDKVDNYIVNTLDRVKPNQRGTKEEIEDYIREHDYLHALAIVSVTPTSNREIKKALKVCWDIGQSTETFSDAVLEPRGNASAESSARNSSSSTHTSSLSVTLDRHNMSDSASSKSDHSPADSRRSSVQTENKSPGSRPPKPAGKSQNGGVPRRSRRRDHSIPRKVDVMDDTHGTSPRLGHHHSRLSSSETCSPDLPPRPTSSGQPRRHSNPSNVLHQTSNPDTTFNLHPYVNQRQRTEFYNLNSPNLKVRKCKSPVVTPNRNKVGRAELLLSVDQSGVKTPPTSSPQSGDVSGFGRWNLTPGHMTDDEHRETQDYFDAVAKASQQKYGHSSIDRSWAKMRRDLSGGDAPDGPLSPGYINTFPPTGYVNIQKLASMEENTATHKRQNSLDTPPSVMSRQNSKTSQGDPTLSPPSIHHSRQRSAPVEGSVSSMGSVLTASNQSYLRPSDDKSPVSPEVKGDDDSEIISMRGKQHRQSSEGRISEASSRHTSQLSGFSTFDQIDSPVTEWLISASCEDLSDHMRNVIYDDEDDDDNDNNNNNNNNDDDGEKAHKGGKGNAKEEDDENTYEEIQSDKEDKSDHNSSTASASNDKPPLPFTGLKKFQNKVDISNHRDRSKSFGYVNHDQIMSSHSGAKPQSSAPSAHLIRKMVAARAKQDNTLRKSLSNPNFLNLGSKEHLFNMKTSSSGNMGSNSGSLHVSAKQKSRSFGSLFPAIKKALSRESLGHSRSTTPERRSSFIFRRRPSEHELRRRSSIHSAGEMTIKGIRMTERSRSFRRVRGAKSVEVLSKSENEEDNRLSTATNVSSPPTLTSHTAESVSNPTAIKATSKVSKKRSSAGITDVKVVVCVENSPPTATTTDLKKSATLPSALLSSTSSSLSPSPAASSSFTSNVHVSLSNSSAGSMSQSSPSKSSPSHHLPPPPLPARKPSSSASNNVPSKHNQSSSSPRRSSNYMNSASIKREEESRGSKESHAASRPAHRSKRRVSDKYDDATKVKEFGAGGDSTSKKNPRPDSSRHTSSSSTSSEVQISAEASGKNKSPTKSRSYKIATKS